MPEYAKEFTPELNQSYLASMLNPIEEREAESIGNARREGAESGLVGQAAMGSRIGAAETEAGRAKQSAISSFNLDVAGKKREERLTGESRSYADIERQKTEEFQRNMAQLGYQFESEQNDKGLAAAKQGQQEGEMFGLASSALKGYGAYEGYAALAAA